MTDKTDDQTKAPQAGYAGRAQLVADYPEEGAQELERRFRALADRWRRETLHLSSVNRKAMHPAYQRIVGMGPEALPLILRELEATRGHWLWALYAITGQDPAAEGSTFDEAVEAWLDWGRRHRHL
ncbi:MAG TPA: hypothetical protein VGV38_10045 [Pyrinomonadaceae bacterium]|nr:hypothetical protein [Pyrinomonadaceae bacterium]